MESNLHKLRKNAESNEELIPYVKINEENLRKLKEMSKEDISLQAESDAIQIKREKFEQEIQNLIDLGAQQGNG